MEKRSDCTTGKRQYEKRDAQTAKNFRSKKGVKGLRIYPCEFCDFWHLTHQSDYREF